MPEKLQAGDVLLTSEAPLGEVAYLSESVEACLGQRLFGLRPKPEVLDSRYLFYLLQHSSLRSQLLQRSSGTTVAGIRQAELVRVALELPPLDHQQRVADALGSFDDLLENNRRRIEILEEMARLLYREWFVHFRFPGHEDVEVVDSELGPIPEGWEMARVEEIQADIRNATAAGPFGSKLGRKDYVDQGVPVIRGTNLAVGGGFLDSGFVYVSEQKAATLSSSMARPGDILVTQRGTLGQCGLIPDTANHSEYVISQSQMKLTCDADKIHPVIVHMQLALPEGVQQVLSMATGSGVPHINLGMFREMKMLVPSRHVQDPFVEATEPMFRLERNLRAQNRVLSEVRDLLLPRLVSGDLDVSELDLDGVLA
ncbi:MAG: restriction endonuclease subunit S [Microthrixaceae bacterium]